MPAFQPTATAWTASDRALMELALEQACSARGRVAPNPAVGAVVARDGSAIAVGATRPPPGPHAEVVALAAAGDAAGGELFVTLEPCAHYGRTPPCADAILRAGIRRVVIALRDPHPFVDGRGVERLRAAGVRVEVGLGAERAAEIIAGFATRVASGRPRAIAKYAMTLDGRIATRTGHARWVSGLNSRAHAHGLRDACDAILVGAGTVLADDPLLTTRLPFEQCGYGSPHHPLRVVLDTHARTPPTARLLAAEAPGRALILTGPNAPPANVDALRAAGAEVVAISTAGGRVAPAAALAELATRGINDLLIEGGGRVHGAFFDAGLVDHVYAYIAPVIVGGAGAPAPVGGRGVETMPDAARIVDRRVSLLGDDVLIAGAVRYDERIADV